MGRSVWMGLFMVALAGCFGGQSPQADVDAVPTAEAVDDTDKPVSSDRAAITADALAPTIRALGEADVVPRAISIELARAVVPSEKVGADLTDADALLRIEPAVPGTLRFTTRHSLVFEPSEPLAANTIYTVELVSVGGPDGPLLGEGLPGWRTELHTPEHAFLRMAPLRVDSERGRVEVDLVFAAPVDIDTVMRSVVFTFDGSRLGDVRFGKTDAPNRVRVAMRSPTLLRKGVLLAKVGEGVKGQDGRAVAGGGDEFALDPNLEPVRIEDASLVEGSSSFAIEVICDDRAVEGRRRWMWSNAAERSFRVSPRCELTEESLRDFVRISPSIATTITPTRGGFRIQGDFQRGAYTLSIDAGATTVDGGGVKRSYSTELIVPALASRVSFLAKGRYLPRSAWKRLPIQHRNIDELTLTVRHVPERNLAFWMSGDSERAGERVAITILEEQIPLKGRPDALQTTWIDVAARLPTDQKGIYELVVSGNGSTDAARLLLTDLNLVAKASAPSGDEAWPRLIDVWAIGMDDPDGRRGVKVQAVRPSGHVLAHCVTNSDGGCRLELPDVELDSTAPFALVARMGSDLTYLKFDELQTETSEFEVQGEPYRGDAAYHASVYTDRGVYRPGDTAHVGVLLRDEANVAPKEGMPVELELIDPQGKAVRRTQLSANAGGLLTWDLAFADYAGTGRYRVEARVGTHTVGSTRFAVEEFVPERMEVHATARGDGFLDTEPVPVAVDARYLFGGSAQGSRYELACRLEPSVFAPANNGQLSYGLPEGRRRARAIDLGMVTGTLDEAGEGTLSCPQASDVGRLHGAGLMVAQVSVFEAGSGRTSKATATAPVHPAKTYVGLDSGVDKVKEGDTIPVTGAVVNWQGEPVKGRSTVELTLVRLEPEWGYQWDEERGHETYKRYWRDVVEGSQSVEVVDGRFAAQMVAMQGGSRFVVRAELNGVRTELELDGDQPYYWYNEGDSEDVTPRPLKPTRLALELPDTTKVGQANSVRFVAPYKGRVLMSVETDEVLTHEWLDVDAGPQTWAFAVKDFVPNVYVSALLVKDPHLDSAQSFLPDRAFGVGSITVEPTAFMADLALSVPSTVRSNSPLDVSIDLGPLSEPTFVTVAAVDVGILSLTNFQTPDPLADVFPKRALGIDTYETVGWSLHLQGMGNSSSTGGDAEAPAGRVQMVKPVSLWSGVIEVPKSGKATVRLDVPQYRGKLRVMVVAAGASKMASADAELTVRDPLVLQTTLPRFLAEGDRAEVPVFVTNISGKPQTVQVDMGATWLDRPGEGDKREAPIAFDGANKTTMTLADGQSGTAVFRVRVLASAGAATFHVSVKAGSLHSEERIDVPFEAVGPRTRRVQQVELTSASLNALPLLDGWTPGTERTTFWVTNNPYGQAFGHLSYLVRYPYGCIEQTTSSSRPLLYVGNLLGTSDPDLVAQSKIEDMLAHGVDRLMAMQTPSGGFAYWMGGTQANLWGTAYATHFLLDARDAGFAVPRDPLNDALDFMERSLSSSTSFKDQHSGTPGGEAYMHFVLARAGKGRKARMGSLLAALGGTLSSQQKEQRYLLMAGLYLAGDRRYEQQLRSPDVSPVRSERSNGWSYYSDLRRRGFVLSIYNDLFGAEGEGGQKLARVVADGLASKRSSRHYTTQELVWGVTGLGKQVTGAAGSWSASVVANGRAIEADNQGTGGSKNNTLWTVSRASEYSSMTVEASAEQGKLFLVVNSEGVERGATFRYGGAGLAVSRAFVNGEGRPISLGSVALGDVIYVRLSLTNRTRSPLNNLALVDRLPGGFEIENPGLGRGSLADWVDERKLWAPDSVNVRDDRLEVFGGLAAGESREVVYSVRAVTSGSYTLPPVEAEAMYNPDVWARAPGGGVVIAGDWQDYFL